MHWPISLLCLLCLLTSTWAGERLGLVYDLQTKELLSIINTAQQDTLDRPGFYTAEGQGFIAVEKSEISADNIISTSQAQQYIRDHVQ